MELAASRRYVALADVLGFTDLVRDLDLLALAGKYDSMLEQVARVCITDVHSVNANSVPPDVRDFTIELGHFIFSDTILIWSENMDSDDLYDIDGRGFFSTLGGLFGVALANSFPLRVGIGFGPCVVRPDRRMFLGEAIVAAYQAERCQDWIGMACHPSCLNAPRAANLRMRSRDGRHVGPLVEYPIPLKSDAPCGELRWTVDWPPWAWVAGVNQELLEAKVARHGGTPHVDKWRRALAYYKERRPMWDHIPDVPVRTEPG